jgi:multidrug efflux pump
MIGALIDGAIKRRKVVLAITLVATLFGLWAYLTLPRESDPNINYGFIVVQVAYPGVSPEDSERLLVRPLETELQSIEGLKEMNSGAMESAAVVLLQFEPDVDRDRALNDVRAKVDLARGRFPPDALPPVIQEETAATDSPVITPILYGNVPERTLHQLALSLQRRLEGVPGVLGAELAGGREEMMEVSIDPVRMQSYGVTPGQLAALIRSNNQLVPAGDLQSGQGLYSVKVPGVVQKPEDLLALTVKASGDRVVTLGDIGDVRRTFKEPQRLTRYNGAPSFAIDVTKRPGANILGTVKLIKAAVSEEQKTWPANVKVAYSFDQSDQIARMLVLLESGLITASILVMVVIIGSLGVRSGLMVGAAIPACFMLTFLLLQAAGMTLNMMVMFGLVLAVGILVDGGIVVVEYADRKMAEGYPKEQAFAMAGKRMFWPVLNGTLTTLSAFLPFLFWNSIAGKYMSWLPLTLIFVLSSSIFIALIFTPALGSVAGRKAGVDAHMLAEIEKSERGDPRQMSGFMGWYARTLSSAAGRPFLVTAVALAVIVAVFGWFAATKHPTEFFLKEDPDHVTVYVQARGNLSIAAQDQLVRQVEQKLTGQEGIDSTYVRIGRTNSIGNGGAPNDSIGRILVQFVDYQQLKKLHKRGQDIADAVRERIGTIPGLGIEVRQPQSGTNGGKAVQIELRSNDPGALNQAADLVLAKMKSTPGLIELEDNRTSPGIEWDLAVDRQAAGRYGVDVSTVGQAIQFVTGGVLVGKFRPDDSRDELDIRLRFPEGDRSIAAFDQLMINTAQGPVPASYFVKRLPAQQVTVLHRRAGQRLALLQANAAKGKAANLIGDDLKAWMKTAPIPTSVRWKFAGNDEDTADASKFFVGAVSATLFLMAMILLWQFNSFYGVVVTLSAVVLSTVGVLLGILVNVGHTFDYISIIMAGTGVVALMGVVVGHNIVLVDTFYQLKRAGYSDAEAAVRSAVQRFRPVVLTTVVTVIGLLPLMFQLDPAFRTGHVEYKAPGSEWWVQMAGTVVWGLGFSTLLTLFMTPAALASPAVLKRRAVKVWRWARGEHGPVQPDPAGLEPERVLPKAAE